MSGAGRPGSPAGWEPQAPRAPPGVGWIARRPWPACHGWARRRSRGNRPGGDRRECSTGGTIGHRWSRRRSAPHAWRLRRFESGRPGRWRGDARRTASAASIPQKVGPPRAERSGEAWCAAAWPAAAAGAGGMGQGPAALCWAGQGWTPHRYVCLEGGRGAVVGGGWVVALWGQCRCPRERGAGAFALWGQCCCPGVGPAGLRVVWARVWVQAWG